MSEHLEVIQDVDVDLELPPADGPGFSRRPDLVVVQRSAHRRVRETGGLIRAAEVVLAEDFGYQDAGGIAVRFATSRPFPVGVELNRLG